MDSNKIKRGLGRGLSSLIGETKIETEKNLLQISDLIPNKYQPRKIFDEDNLNDLTNSIKERGILQPIIVRKSNDDKSNSIWIIDPLLLIEFFNSFIILILLNFLWCRLLWKRC